MSKIKAQYFWLDAFNLFHRWNRTSQLFKQNHEDVNHCHQTAIRLLSTYLGKFRNRTTAFMDGGVSRHSATLCGVKIRYPGPGKKADDLLEEAARAGKNNRSTAVVTSDNFLAATMRRNGTRIISCEEFIAKHLQKTVQQENTEVKPEIKLSEQEVNDWLDIFSDEE